jgi:hypothetical protein
MEDLLQIFCRQKQSEQWRPTCKKSAPVRHLQTLSCFLMIWCKPHSRLEHNPRYLEELHAAESIFICLSLAWMLCCMEAKVKVMQIEHVKDQDKHSFATDVSMSTETDSRIEL